MIYYPKVMVLGLLLMAVSCSRSEKYEPSKEGDDLISYVRPAARGGNSAAYFSYNNPLQTADTLLSIEANVTKRTQVHDSYVTDEGLMGMREVNSLVIQGGDSLIFRQGGMHVMLMQADHALMTGDSVRIRLHFAKAGWVEKVLPVQP